jgi:hypothetical protein
MTSPSYDTFFEVPNYVAEVCLPGHDRSLDCTQRAQKIGHEDSFAEDTTGITHGNDLRLPLVDNVVRSKSKCMAYVQTQ